MRKIINHSFTSLISLTNLFQAWEEFKNGKRNKKDVQLFERHLEDNLFDLYFALKSKSYKHGGYFEFYVNDPKRRHIHKARVCDRIVHHLLYKYLYDIFDKTFIYDSYSCRLNKGTHRSVKRLEKYARMVSKNYTQECWALKLDIKQFFASVDHDILKGLIRKNVSDRDILWLIDNVIDSFSVRHPVLDTGSKKPCLALDSRFPARNASPARKAALNAAGGQSDAGGRGNDISDVGIPLGNLTSQILANIYLNQLDQFIKHDLKIKYYIRYADDFIILNTERLQLQANLIAIENFLKENLKLQLHPKKIIIRKLIRGIDFCGYVILPHYILPRARTKRRILNKVSREQTSSESIQSYLGYFSHAKSYRTVQNIKNVYYLNNKAD